MVGDIIADSRATSPGIRNQNAPLENVTDDSPTGFVACGETVFPPFESCAAALPEPASLGLLGIALGLLCAIRPVRRHLISGRVLNPIRPGTPTPERALTAVEPGITAGDQAHLPFIKSNRPD
jgi:hypothetical protein